MTSSTTPQRSGTPPPCRPADRHALEPVVNVARRCVASVVLATAILLGLTACSFSSYLVLVNNTDQPLAVTWQLVRPGGDGCAMPQTVPIGADWTGSLGLWPESRLPVQQVPIGDAGRGCRTVMPSRSVVVLLHGTNEVFDATSMPLARLELDPSAPGTSYATTAEAAAAVHRFADGVTGFVVGEPPPDDVDWDTVIGWLVFAVGGLLWIVTPVVVSVVRSTEDDLAEGPTAPAEAGHPDAPKTDRNT
jgi:hypothetical protein